jgi:hypothetical protein
MSPIDDELRAALHGRARVLDPTPTRWPASSGEPGGCGATGSARRSPARPSP